MIADRLDLDRTALTWVVTAYTLCLGGLMLLGGRMADALGRRRAFLAGLAIFTLASLASGLAGEATLLVAARAAQGASCCWWCRQIERVTTVPLVRLAVPARRPVAAGNLVM